MGFALFIVAAILTSIFGPIGLIVGIIYYFIELDPLGALKALDNMFKAVAVAIDKLGAILCAPLFNYTLILPNGYRFGEPGLTVSFVLGINYIEETLSTTGRIIVLFLDIVDNLKYLPSFLIGKGPYFRISHVIEAVKHQYVQDLKANKRSQELKELLDRD